MVLFQDLDSVIKTDACLSKLPEKLVHKSTNIFACTQFCLKSTLFIAVIGKKVKRKIQHNNMQKPKPRYIYFRLINVNLMLHKIKTQK